MFKDFNILNNKGLIAIAAWVCISIIIGITLGKNIGNYTPSIIETIFSNYTSLIRDKITFLSILLCFIFLSPFFIVYILLKGMNNFILSYNNESVLYIFIICGIFINTPFINYENLNKFTKILYRIIIIGSWEGAIFLCISLLIMPLVCGLALIKYNFYCKNKEVK